MADVEATHANKTGSDSGKDAVSVYQDSDVPAVGRENLSDLVPPHESYEGRHRWDPTATWTAAEERAVVRKTDLKLLTWLCVMFFGLQLDRGNLSNALADDFLKDMKLSSDDYNNVRLDVMLCVAVQLANSPIFREPRSSSSHSCAPSSPFNSSPSVTASSMCCRL